MPLANCIQSWTSLVAQMVKCLPTMRETWVRSLGWEDPLEKEMATHSSILAWKIPRMEEPGKLQSVGLERVGHDWATSPYLTLPPEMVVINIYDIARGKKNLAMWFRKRIPQFTKLLHSSFDKYQKPLRVINLESLELNLNLGKEGNHLSNWKLWNI